MHMLISKFSIIIHKYEYIHIWRINVCSSTYGIICSSPSSSPLFSRSSSSCCSRAIDKIFLESFGSTYSYIYMYIVYNISYNKLSWYKLSSILPLSLSYDDAPHGQYTFYVLHPC
jgi:hypothetical protein